MEGQLDLRFGLMLNIIAYNGNNEVVNLNSTESASAWYNYLNISSELQVFPPAATPEPASMLIFGLGTAAAGACAAVRRKMNRKR